MLRIATRKSPLALQQSKIVANKLQSFWPNLEVQLLPMSTEGDERLDKKLLEFGGKSLFVKELEIALLENRADIAVHSIKDLPSQLPKGLHLDCILSRDNPFDAFISKKFSSLKDLKKNATIGTSSLRRQAQLLHKYPHLNIQTLRGNIHTRLEKLNNEEFDAIILASAGLWRMNLEHLITEQLTIEQMLPACGQGAIGIECREKDANTQGYLKPLHDPKTAICIELERQVNKLLGGHCHVPIAIFAQIIDDNHIELRATVLNAIGQKKIKWQASFPLKEANENAILSANTLLKQGADKLIRE